MAVDAAAVKRAHGRISGIIHETPVLSSRTLNEIAGGTLYLKMESFQRTGAFKFRGAFHAVSRQLEAAREHGVVTGSSGNHGGALALAARILGVPATVVMPEDSAAVKIAAVEGFGATIEYCGLSSTERLDRAQVLADEQGMLMIPPYDHEDIIAGQGTVALEALEQVPELDLFLAPCGGGGLLSGCAAYLAGEAPHVEVWGVEPVGADDTLQSFEKGERVTIDLPDTIADGVRNLTPGEMTFPIVRRHCRGVVLVDDDETVEALRLLMLRAKVVSEPTGAVAPAALLSGKLSLEGRCAVAVVSGGNVDPGVLSRCLEAAQ
ncbi:MAG: hypothetical protein CMJ83_21195 [Planctomycetes bacterium]|nr:hypothetical protein [Planctomycetota bacterium]